MTTAPAVTDRPRRAPPPRVTAVAVTAAARFPFGRKGDESQPEHPFRPVQLTPTAALLTLTAATDTAASTVLARRTGPSAPHG
ncbi:hypothetical protein [Streptomyces sp. NPDC005423]|uniref:hypothetical protein n=1 Tax=Streptomyces sp. NPDC005423 TaxID=3155343 RepID=UPI0033A68BC2